VQPTWGFITQAGITCVSVSNENKSPSKWYWNKGVVCQTVILNIITLLRQFVGIRYSKIHRKCDLSSLQLPIFRVEIGCCKYFATKCTSRQEMQYVYHREAMGLEGRFSSLGDEGRNYPPVWLIKFLGIMKFQWAISDFSPKNLTEPLLFFSIWAK